MIDAQEQEQGMEYAALQRKAIVTALSRGIMILTGGPGTGKDHDAERHHFPV